jgi:hypothetical protein
MRSTWAILGIARQVIEIVQVVICSGIMERVAGADRCQKAPNAKRDGLQAQATGVVMRESRSRCKLKVNI